MTHSWIHVMMTVTRHSVKAFMDGSAVADSDFGEFCIQMMNSSFKMMVFAFKTDDFCI